MKVLILVVSSNTDPVYRHHKQVWQTYMRSNPDVDCYFVEYSPVAFVPSIRGNTLVLRGTESYENIVKKTIQALEFFVSRTTYDFVVRTNLSSVWIFPKLLAFLGAVPRSRYYGGVICTHEPWNFVSGAGILMSWDTCLELLRNRAVAYSAKRMDDVDIGLAMVRAGIVAQPAPRVDIHSEEDIAKQGFHYRVRFYPERDREPGLMHAIVKRYS